MVCQCGRHFEGFLNLFFLQSDKQNYGAFRMQHVQLIERVLCTIGNPFAQEDGNHLLGSAEEIAATRTSETCTIINVLHQSRIKFHM